MKQNFPSTSAATVSSLVQFNRRLDDLIDDLWLAVAFLDDWPHDVDITLAVQDAIDILKDLRS